jgi:hypothetical protein
MVTSANVVAVGLQRLENVSCTSLPATATVAMSRTVELFANPRARSVGDVHVVCHPNDAEGVDAADASEKLPTDQLSTAVNAIAK